MSDGEPAPPGLSSRMKERLGRGSSSGRGDEEKKRKKRDEPARPPRRDYRPRENRYNSHRDSNRELPWGLLERLTLGYEEITC